MNDTFKVQRGDYVETGVLHHRGRVLRVHPQGCPESRDWFAQQIAVHHGDYSGPWVSILCDESNGFGGGSVVVPAWDVSQVSPFPFTNSYAAEAGLA